MGMAQFFVRNQMQFIVFSCCSFLLKPTVPNNDIDYGDDDNNIPWSYLLNDFYVSGPYTELCIICLTFVSPQSYEIAILCSFINKKIKCKNLSKFT